MNEPYEIGSDHPTESALADLVLGRLTAPSAITVAQHVESCHQCQVMVGRLARAVPDLPDVVELGATPAVPDPTLRAVAAADEPKAGPRAGELWRARDAHGGPVTLVWLREVGRRAVAAIPVSFDVELADEYSLVVGDDASPLGLPLAFHVSVETSIGRDALFDRLGSIDVAEGVDAVRTAMSNGEPVLDAPVGARSLSPIDERVEYRQALADRMAELAGDNARDDGAKHAHAYDDQEPWWPLDARTERTALLVTIHEALRETHPAARITPRPPGAGGSDAVNAVALVAELDAFVLIASVDHAAAEQILLECARDVLQNDQLLNAVCLSESSAPFMSVVIDRRDVVAAIETPSGELRPPRRSRAPAPIGDALSKFLDATISPFGRLAGTVVDAQAIDPRALAVDVSAEAVRAVAASAKGFKVEGKRPGYERVTRHQPSITHLVEQALGDVEVDVAAMLEEPE
jgi:hypothetical protein